MRTREAPASSCSAQPSSALVERGCAHPPHAQFGEELLDHAATGAGGAATLAVGRGDRGEQAAARERAQHGRGDAGASTASSINPSKRSTRAPIAEALAGELAQVVLGVGMGGTTSSGSSPCAR